MQRTPQAEWLTLREAADALGISEVSARRWVKAGKLKAAQPGRKYLVHRDTVAEMLRPTGEGATEAPQLTRAQFAEHGIPVDDLELATLNRLLEAYYELAQTGKPKTTITIPRTEGPGEASGVDMERIYLLVDYAVATGILTAEDVRSLTQGMRAKLVGPR